MKKILLPVLLLLSYQGFSQNPDEAAIRQSLAAQTEAWNRGDIEAFMDPYWKNDSLLFIGQKGPTYGWHNTLANYKKAYPDTTVMGKLTFTILVTKRLSAEYYQVIGKWHLSRSIGDAAGYFTLLWRKIEGKWVIISDHSS